MKTSTRYLDEFVGLRCAPDLLALRLFPNAKEVTETMAAYAACRAHLRAEVPFNDPRVLLLAVGDGAVPRTGATFAFMSAWTCVSVDPRLRDRFTQRVGALESAARRLTAVRAKVEDAELPSGFDAVVVAAVHSHARMSETVKAARACGRRVYAVSIPCCVPSDIREPDVSYEDPGVLSPHRTVQVWRGLEAP